MLNQRNILAGALCIVILAALFYFPALHNGYIWDDDHYVTQNVTLRSLQGLYRIWFELRAVPQYYPFVHSTYWLEYQLWGLNPFGYHLVNIILHAINALLIWYVLRKLAVPGAWLAAAIFAVHPVHVESVAWITERKNVLSACFYFLSLLCYMRTAGFARAESADGSEDRKSFLFYLLSLFCFIGALLSKTVTCSLPAVILLVLWWKRGYLRISDIKPLVPFFLIGIGLGLQTVWLEKHGVGAQGNEFDYSFIERFLIAGRVLWHYLGKLIWPNPLAFFYPRWTPDVHAWWQFMYPAGALAGLTGLVLARKKIGRGSAAALLFFAGTLFPALGFFNVFPMRFSFVADHFQYLASIGPLALCAAAGSRLFLKLPGYLRPARPVVIAVLLFTLGVLTWQQTKIYKDEETLWRDTINKNPTSWIAHMNLGKTFFDQGRVDDAIEYFLAAGKIKPDVPMTLSNLGVAYIKKRDYERAYRYLSQAVQLYPEYADAQYNLGVACALTARDTEAIDHFLTSLKFMPDSPLAYFNLGQVFEGQGKIKQAVLCYAETVRLEPEHPIARARLEKLQSAAPALNPHP